MSSIRRRAAVVLAVLLLAGAGGHRLAGPVASPRRWRRPRRHRRRRRRRPTPQTPPAPQTPAQPARRTPAGAERATAASRRRPADLPRRHQLRARRRHRHRSLRQSGHRPHRRADFELAEDGKPQTVETFRLVQIDTSAPVETAAAADHPRRRGDRRPGRGRPHRRLLPRRLPRAARQQHGLAQAPGRVRDDPARPQRPGRGDVPAQPARQRDPDPRSRSAGARPRALPGPQVRLHAAQRARGSLRQLPGRDRRAGPPAGVAVGAAAGCR